MIAAAIPERKIEVVRDLQKCGAVVAVIGDGVNDAPGLAQADIGITLSSGTDVAMKAAPLVISGDSLLPVLKALDLARNSLRIVRQNLFWAFLYNTIAVSLAVAGAVNPILAADAMVISSLSAIWNAKRIR